MQIYFLEIELRLFRVHSGQGKPGKPGKRAVLGNREYYYWSIIYSI